MYDVSLDARPGVHAIARSQETGVRAPNSEAGQLSGNGGQAPETGTVGNRAGEGNSRHREEVLSETKE